ncbi:unnamed protein product [Malus baccata var. baccata]
MEGSSSSSSSSSSSAIFYDFLDRMRDPASLDLVRSIKRDHPLWAGATDEEVNCAMEGLEKYVMTKLFSRTFASSPEDAKIDRETSHKIHLLQTFLKPEHLDIPVVLHNEASWLVNPPQLHSNLKFIQLYRRQTKLVSEAAYYFTNLVSAKTFIFELNAKSISIDEIEFEKSMQAARLTNKATEKGATHALEEMTASQGQTDPGSSAASHYKGRSGSSNYPYVDKEAEDLTVGDVERLLSAYKEVVTKYTSLCAAVRKLSFSRTEPHATGLEARNVVLTESEETDKNSDQRG